MRYRFRLIITGLAVITLLCGCRTATHITRQEQLSHATTAAVTEPATTAPSIPVNTTAAPEDTTPATTVDEIVPATRETLPPETTKPPATKATAPKPTDPPQTTVPATEPATEPAAAATEPEAPEDDPYDISSHSCGALEYAVLEALNADRAEAGLAPLTLSGRLSAISSVRAYESSVNFSHTRPDGRDCFTVLSDYGYGFGGAAENLLQCSEGYSASDMVTLWMGSAGHRANILDPGLATVGIGVYRSGGMIYVATIFTN